MYVCHVDQMVKFRNSLLERLSNKYIAVMAHPLPKTGVQRRAESTNFLERYRCRR